jgi:nucleoside-diphosphate-sugar epimerase
LLARGDRVRALVRSDARPLSGLEVEIVRGDICDKVAVGSLLEGAGRAFHAAATVSIDPRDDAAVLSNNVETTQRVAEACLERGVRMVHFSSIHALASHDGPIDETGPLADDHRFAYDRSKARAEAEVLARVARGLDAVIVNPTAVIGPFDFRPSEAGRMLLKLARRKLPCVVDGGFNWVDARDVASGAIAAAERGGAGERYLLAGDWRNMRDLTSLACAAAGVRPPRWCVPIGVASLGIPFASLIARMTGTKPLFTKPALEALRHHRDVRGEKAARELGYRPRPLEATLRDTYAWFKEAGLL